jgi:hypothetical protein
MKARTLTVEGKPAIARIQGPQLLIVWNRGIAVRDGTLKDLDALPQALALADLAAFTIEDESEESEE